MRGEILRKTAAYMKIREDFSKDFNKAVREMRKSKYFRTYVKAANMIRHPPEADKVPAELARGDQEVA